MNKAISVILLGLVLVLSITAVAAPPAEAGPKMRVIAHGDGEVASALSLGCDLVRSTKGMTALLCPDAAVSALGLAADVPVHALDSGANAQISADDVQSSGNDGTGTVIVVLDTGYNYNHPELSSSYLGGWDFVNDDADPMDDQGHGTHVAGLITADGVVSRAKGVAPGAGVLAGKVLDSSGNGYFSDIVAGIYWAVDGPDGVYGTADDPDADAISISIGTSKPYVYKGTCDNVLPDVTNAIKYAVDHGVVVVVAAGNEGKAGVSLPGCVSYSTTVAAVGSNDKSPTWSSKGSAVDVSAPGVSLYSTYLGTGYASMSGTSMATPVVSGTVALVKAAHPDFTPAQVESALTSTAKDLGKAGKDTTFGWGRIEAYKAVNYAG